jgi:hypothetical protein
MRFTTFLQRVSPTDTQTLFRFFTMLLTVEKVSKPYGSSNPESFKVGFDKMKLHRSSQCFFCTLNPNPDPQTPNPKPQTLKPEPKLWCLISNPEP